MPTLFSSPATTLHHTTTHLPTSLLTSPLISSRPKNPIPASYSPPSPLPLPLPNYPLPPSPNTSLTHTLPSGHTLGYALFGCSPETKTHTIIFHHGIPGSRLEGALFDELAKELGVMIVGVDRPGMGLSDMKEGWTLTQFAGMVEDLVVRGLGVREWGVLAMSGGGPSALAHAYHILSSSSLSPSQTPTTSKPSSRLKSLTLVAALSHPTIPLSGSSPLIRLGFTLGFPYSPGWLLQLFWQSSSPTARLSLPPSTRLSLLKTEFSTKKTPPDTKPWDQRERAIESDPHFQKFMVANGEEAFRQGFEGVRQDGKTICDIRRWGFDSLEQIVELQRKRKEKDGKKEVRVRLWYGVWDENVPVGVGVETARRLGRNGEEEEDGKDGKDGCEWKRKAEGKGQGDGKEGDGNGDGKSKKVTLRVVQETHVGVEMYWMREILKEMVRDLEEEEE